jgi:3-hydroxyacyl-CoA dehydrogenase
MNMSERSQINENQVAIIGAGTMGAGIAQKYASSGYLVHVVDRNEQCLLNAKKKY